MVLDIFSIFVSTGTQPSCRKLNASFGFMLSMVYDRTPREPPPVPPRSTLTRKQGLLAAPWEEEEPWHSPPPLFPLNQSRNPDRQPFFNKSAND